MKIALTIAGLFIATGAAFADEIVLPEKKTQPSAEAVLDEHFDALNKCDWNRIMAQYPDDAVFILPSGVWFEGPKEISKLFTGFCKDRKDGGLKGSTFVEEKRVVIGDTINVSWRLEADFLKEPYKGADAYVTRDGMMQGQVTTFDTADMKFK
jgi:ketosteroid isomerase-like protein